MSAKWIRFEKQPLPEGRKTDIWRVISTSRVGVLLGQVSWYVPWRKFCFYPNKALSLVFEEDCLRDIADFCVEQTQSRRKAS